MILSALGYAEFYMDNTISRYYFRNKTEYSEEDIETITDQLVEIPYTEEDGAIQTKSIRNTEYDINYKYQGDILIVEGQTLYINTETLFISEEKGITHAEGLQLLNEGKNVKHIRYTLEDGFIIQIIFAS